ncbi:hypothetical protein FWC63_00670 [Candidatus Saccharibacteria bacterium]|nr:hypothetical protein [Candidatus Saccharibacteria bacterium]
MKQKVYEVITPTDIKPKPSDEEQIVAGLMAEYLKSNVRFVKRGTNTTPDIEVKGQLWEIEHPRKNGPRTMQGLLRKADNQSDKSIISLLRYEATTKQAVGRIKVELLRANKIRRLILITKSRKLLVIK